MTIFGLLWLYFRRWHGVVIPAIAGIGTVIWGLGFTGWWGIAFDPLILVIPMIITARAVSHTVQMAERFFEDYEVMLPRLGDPKQARIEVATIAMSELVIPGTLGIVTDVAGLLVIMLTTIPQMYNLGLFGAVWVSSIIVTVEILHPILICYMPAPTEHEHFLPEFMLRFTRGVGWATTDPFWKYVIGGVTVDPARGLDLHHALLLEDRRGDARARRCSGRATSSTSPPTRSRRASAASIRWWSTPTATARTRAPTPAPIKAMERFERDLKVNTNLGASVSLVPFLRNFWQINHYGDPKWYFVPVAPGHGARGDLPAPAERPARRHAPLPDRRRARGEHLVLLPGSPGRDDRPRRRTSRRNSSSSNPLGEVSIRLDKDKAAPDAGFFDKEKPHSTSGTTCSGRCCRRASTR